MCKRLLLVSVVFLLLVSVAPGALAQSDCDHSFSNYARAVMVHDAGDYDRALRYYDCALQEDPDSAIIPIMIENVYEDIASAATAWSRATEPPQDSHCNMSLNHRQLAADTLAAGKIGMALLHLDCVLQDQPGDQATFHQLGMIHISLGQTRAARYYFDRSNDPPVDTVSVAAETFSSRSDYQLALDQYLALLAFEPNSADMPYRIALMDRILALRLDGVEKAKDYPKEREPSLEFGLGWPAPTKRDAVGLPHWVSSALADKYFDRARQRAQLAAWELARDAYLSGLALEPTRNDARCELGMVYAILGDDRAALREFDLVLFHDGLDACAWSNRDALLQRMRGG